MKYTITKIFKKDGVSKSGKEYTKLSIQTKEKEDVWLSGFANSTSLTWKEGDIVDLELTEREYEGKVYFDYKILSSNNSLDEKVERLEKRMKEFELSMISKFADLKSDLLLETKGTFQTEKEYEKMNNDYPVKDEMSDLVDEMKAQNDDDIPF